MGLGGRLTKDVDGCNWLNIDIDDYNRRLVDNVDDDGLIEVISMLMIYRARILDRWDEHA